LARLVCQPLQASAAARRAEELVETELETVLYAQMLVLFAPHAVAARTHIPPLLQTLTSRQPALRQAAAATLRHLAERCGAPGLDGCQTAVLGAWTVQAQCSVQSAAPCLASSCSAVSFALRWARCL
jgi:hypothetical protein